MKQLLIYDRPIALNRNQHRHLRIKPSLPGYQFASKLNSVPLTVAEFGDALRDYPIVFAGSPDNASMPVALLGLTQAENLFVQDDGLWDAGAYVPAFLRRYPFVVADQDQGDNFAVCVEGSFISDDPDAVPLFDENGADTPVLAQAVKFLADYQQAVARTRAFMEQLREHKLLVNKAIHVDRKGAARQSLNGFCIVDESRLGKLSARALEKLSRTGALGLAYLQVASLGNVKRLASRLDARSQVPSPLH
ncbi:multidrug transporter [Dyella solisilvae]|uniref:Multidrug transporter n=1 Tax=Dyella solisilvae TaxID=1920168 RepID=A0A370KBX3_9GAMM|nr:SapC family protein [Dyella solisilvae]RDI99947.1 multidrug transporter [Dyella solisilvae]